MLCLLTFYRLRVHKCAGSNELLASAHTEIERHSTRYVASISKTSLEHNILLLVRHACELTADIPQPASSGIVQRKPARLDYSASHYILAMYLCTCTPTQSQA